MRQFVRLFTVIVTAFMGLLIGIQASPAHAQTIPLDPNFGVNGFVSGITFPGYTVMRATHVAPLPDGRFIVAVVLQNGVPNNEDIGLIRYNSNGSIDASFGNNGYAVIDWNPNATDSASGGLRIDSTGRIIVSGSTGYPSDPDWAIAVLTPAGVLNTAFDSDGKLVIAHAGDYVHITGTIIDEANNIVLTGVLGTICCSTFWRVTRVSTAGALDNSFIVDNPFSRAAAIARDHLGRYVLASVADSNGYYITTRRLLSSGTNDNSYSGDGSFSENLSSSEFPGDLVRRVVIQSDNRIVIATGSYAFHAWRYNDSGVDTSFGNSGRITVDWTPSGNGEVNAALVDSQDRIIMAGYSFANMPIETRDVNMALVRLTANGQPDATFGTNGVMEIDYGVGLQDDNVRDMAFMPDGDVVLVGTVNNTAGMVRLDFGVPIVLVQNGSFETAESTQPGNAQKWAGTTLTKDKRTCNTISPPVTYSHTGSCAFLFKGGSGEKSQISQTINPDPSLLTAGTALTLSGWIESAANSVLGKVVVYYTDGTKQAFSVAMGPALSYTQFTSAPFFLAKNASKFKVSFKHTYPSGKLYLDDVALIPNAARTRDGVLPLPGTPNWSGWRSP